eukprot:scaffold297387_cov19-Prasinocladus_malaysianus.AAC.1
MLISAGDLSTLDRLTQPLIASTGNQSSERKVTVWQRFNIPIGDTQSQIIFQDGKEEERYL